MYIYILLIHSSVDGNLGCFHVLAAVNNAAMLILTLLLIFVGIYPKWNCWMIWQFFKKIFLRKLRTIFYSGCTILLSHQQHARVLISPHPCQNLLISVFFLNNSHCNGHEVVTYCGFQFHFHNDEWYWASFHVLIDHSYIILEKCWHKSYSHFWIKLFFFIVVVVKF